MILQKNQTVTENTPRIKSKIWSNSKNKAIDSTTDSHITPKSKFEVMLTNLSDTIKTLPLYHYSRTLNKLTAEKETSELLKNLRKIKSDDFFYSKAKAEITKFLNMLPIWEPKDPQEQVIYVNKLADDLLNGAISRAKFVEDKDNLVPNNINRENEISKIVENFVNILKSLIPDQNTINSEVLKPKLMEFINQLPLKYSYCSEKEVDKFINEFIDSIILELNEKYSDFPNKIKSIDESKLQDAVLSWLQSLNQSSCADDFDVKINSKALADILKKIFIDQLNNDKIKEDIQKDIEIWLDSTYNKFDNSVEDKVKFILSKNLLKILLDDNLVDKTMIGSNKGDIVNKYLLEVIEWLQGIPELKKYSSDTMSEVKSLVETLNQIKSTIENPSEIQRKMKGTISDWLQSILLAKKININNRNQENLVNALLSKISELEIQHELDQYYKEIMSWLQNISFNNLKTDSEESRSIKDVVKKINTLNKSNHIDRTNKIQDELNKLVFQLSKKYRKNINDDQRKKLEEILNSIVSKSKPRKRWSKQNNVEQHISNKISKIINDIVNINKNLKEKIKQIIESNIRNGQLSDKDEIISKLSQFLGKFTNLADSKIVAKDLINKVNAILKCDDHSPSSDIECVENISSDTMISDKIKYITSSNQDTQKYKGNTHQSQSSQNNTPFQEFDLLDQSKHLHNKVEELGERRRLSKDNKFEYLPEYMITSTPYTSTNNILESINGKNTLLQENDDYKHCNLSRKSDYLSNLKHVLKNWFQQFNNIISDSEITDIVDDIANDITERENYLRLSQKSPAYDKELEYFNFFMFRLLSKIKGINSESLKVISSKTPDLYQRIKKINFPKPPKRNIDNELLKTKILNWVEDIPKSFLMSDRKSYLKNLTDEIFDNIKPYLVNANFEINEIILQWLKKVIKNVNGNNRNEFGEMFKEELDKIINLCEKQQETIESNLKKAIINWLKDLPSKKDHIDINEIAQNLIEHLLQYTVMGYDDDSNEELLKSIVTNKLVDASLFDEQDYSYCQDLVSNVLPKIKKIINDNLNVDSEDYLCSSIFTSTNEVWSNPIKSWCSGLPIYVGDKKEDKERENIIRQNIISKMLNKISQLNLDPEVFNNDLLYYDILESEVDNLLCNIPLKRKSESNITLYKAILMEKIKEAKQKTKHNLKNLAYKQIIRDTIAKTFPHRENLSLEEESSLEKLKDSLVDAFIKLHYISDNEKQLDLYKEILLDELGQFCNEYLKRSLPLNSSDIHFQLFNALQKVPPPSNEYLKSEIEHIKIKDVVNDWLRDIFKNEPSLLNCISSKMISLLSHRLYNLLKAKDDNKYVSNKENNMKGEIARWFDKLSTDINVRLTNIESLICNLIERLKAVEKPDIHDKSKMVSSFIKGYDKENKSMFDVETSKLPIHQSKTYALNVNKNATDMQGGIKSKPVLIIDTQSTLSNPQGDRPRLDTLNASARVKSVDTDTQTKHDAENSVPPDFVENTSFTQEVIPNVLIKNYLWDSISNESIQSSNIILPLTETHVTKSPNNTLHSNEILQRTQRVSRQNHISEEDIIPNAREIIRRASLIMDNCNDLSDRPDVQQTLRQNEKFSKKNCIEAERKSFDKLFKYQESQLPLVERIRSAEKPKLRDSKLDNWRFGKEDNLQNRFLSPVLEEPHLQRGCRCYASFDKISFFSDGDKVREKAKSNDSFSRNRILTKCQALSHACDQVNVDFYGECSDHSKSCYDEYCPYPCDLYFR